VTEENGLTPLEEERRKSLFGKESEIDETLISTSASAKDADSPPEEQPETKEPLYPEPSLEETMGGASDTAPETPPWEMPESDDDEALEEAMPESHEEEALDEAMPDVSDLDEAFPDLDSAPLEEDEPLPLPEPDVTIMAEGVTPAEPEPEIEAAEIPAEPVEAIVEEPVVEPAVEEPAVEEVAPVELEAVPEAELGAVEVTKDQPKLPAWIEEAESEAAAQPQEADPTAEDLKAAPVIDWSSMTADEAVEATSEGLAKLAAPFTALPAADAPIDVPSPVLKSEEAKPFPLVEAPETAKETVVMARITEARQQKLMTRIDNLLDHVYDQYSLDTDHGVLEEVLKLLKTARHTMIENPRDYDTAEYYTHRAKLLIDNFHNVRKDSYGWPGWGLVIYETLFMISVGLLWIFGDEIAKFFVSRGAAEWALAPWYAMLAGASGGVFGAFWALYRHIARDKDFSRQYTMWYIGSPITGGLAGISIFFLSQVGVLGMNAGSSGNLSAEIVNPNWFLAAIALLAGFKQNVILDLFARLVKLIDASDK